MSRKAMVWNAVAVLFYARVTLSAASAAAMFDGSFPVSKRLAGGLASLPGVALCSWMDWDATVGGFSVTMAIVLALAISMGLAVCLARSYCSAVQAAALQHAQRNAVILEERLREQTRQKMRRTRAAG